MICSLTASAAPVYYGGLFADLSRMGDANMTTRVELLRGGKSFAKNISLPSAT
jgi:hypothetical protein